MTTSRARRCCSDGPQGCQGAASHTKGWLDRVDELVQRGKDADLADDPLQEAGDSLMMKLGEAANRLSRLGVLAPDGVEWALAVASRNFLIHQYDETDRALTWPTLSQDLPAWNESLQELYEAAAKSIEEAQSDGYRWNRLCGVGVTADARCLRSADDVLGCKIHSRLHLRY